MPENNITDSAAEAWNDAITVSDDSSSEHSVLLMVPLPTPEMIQQPRLVETLTITVAMHSQGM